MHIRTISISILVAIGIALVSPTHGAHAANTDLHISGPKSVALGQTFSVRLIMSSASSINAMSGNVQYSGELLGVQGISYNRSIFKLWQQTPNNSPQTNQIVFAGGLPNPGFSGKNGEIIQITFKARALGTATVQLLNNSQVLLNDGQGSRAEWSATPYTVQINKPETEPTPPPTEPSPVAKDTTPPTHLELLIGHDSHLFEGNWFAVFRAEDLESGIDHYELAEIDNNQTYPVDADWRKVTSPYQLLKQEQSTKVFLKAVDKSGNISTISREHKPTLISFPKPDWRLLLVLAVILALGLILPIFVYHRKKLESSVQK